MRCLLISLITGDNEHLTTELRLNFGTPQLPSELAYKSLSSLKMDAGENVQFFYEKFLRNSKYQKINSDMLGGFFVGGLPNTIKSYVLLRQPPTFRKP